MPCKEHFATQRIPNLLKFMTILIQKYIQEKNEIYHRGTFRGKKGFCSLIILVKEESLTISFLLICAKTLFSFLRILQVPRIFLFALNARNIRAVHKSNSHSKSSNCKRKRPLCEFRYSSLAGKGGTCSQEVATQGLIQ